MKLATTQHMKHANGLGDVNTTHDANVKTTLSATTAHLQKPNLAENAVNGVKFVALRLHAI